MSRDKVCQRQGCDNVITDARRKDRMYCSVYCNQRSWDLKNRTPKKFQMEEKKCQIGLEMN